MINETLLLLLTVCFISFNGLTQNLVPNGNFENTTALPAGSSGMYRTPPWDFYLRSPFVFNSFGSSCLQPRVCYGIPYKRDVSQPAFSGNSYAGIFIFSFGIQNAFTKLRNLLLFYCKKWVTGKSGKDI